MYRIIYFQCKNCAELFEEKSDCLTHEEECLPLEVGQLVLFPLGLFQYEGRVTEVHKTVSLGKKVSKAHVLVETDVEIDDEVDWSQFHDGKHFVFLWNEVTPVDTPSQENAA